MSNKITFIMKNNDSEQIISFPSSCMIPYSYQLVKIKTEPLVFDTLTQKIRTPSSFALKPPIYVGGKV